MLVDKFFDEDGIIPFEKYKDNSKFFLTTKAHKSYVDVKYDEDSLLIFGRETKGLPDWIHEEFAEDCVRIPMVDEARCLNLSNSAAIVAYEALRQATGFKGFKV